MSLRILLLTALFLSLIAFFISAQEYGRELNTIPFSDPDGAIPNVFSGGINNLEHQFVDIDGDGDLDIFFLDSDGTYGWYENTGTSSSPIFILSFDSIPGFKAVNWFYLIDIDNDGDFDLFTAGGENFIEFRRNTGTVSFPFFSLEIDTLKDINGDPILSEFGSNPLFADVDADGDKDFISGNSIGTLTYFENTGTPQDFSFKFISNEWQGIQIGEGIFRTKSFRHGASSLEFGDLDNDGDLDLLWGDFFSSSLYYIQNNGTPSEPNLSLLYSRYPPNQDSVNTSGFNMPRLADIDGDGDLDLFVSVLYDPTVPQPFLFYENQGSSFNPNFKKITENYLKTVDVGNSSAPAFADIDWDGDMDLFLGSAKNPNGSLHFFENTGTVSSPSFLLIDSAYFGIKSELAIAPALGDLDGDGDFDLLIGRFDGKIEFYRNTGTPQSPNFIFESLLTKQGDTIIDIGVYARPFLIDYDSDGDLDLAVGRFNGRISFFKNTGTPGQFIFEEDYEYFVGIDVGDNSSPFLIDYDGDGVLDLFSGERFGSIIYYKNTGTNLSPIWTLSLNNFLNQSFGSDPVINFVDIDGDGDKDIFIGNVKGGLYFYRNLLISNVENSFSPSIPEDFHMEAYPNPFNSRISFNVKIERENNYKIKIFNSLGEVIENIFSGNLKAGLHNFQWEVISNVSSGVYLATIEATGKLKSIKIILLK